MAPRIPVFLNERAGTSEERSSRRFEVLTQALSEEPSVERFEFLDPNAIAARVRQALETGAERVVVGGGDGTLGTAAGILAGTTTVLGVLPLGTLNHFAQDAGIPLDLREAARAAIRGEARPLDVGEVNGHTFLNTCSIGGYVTALRRRERLRRRARHGKARAMFWGTLAALRRVPRLHVTLSSRERNLSLRASFVLVSNNAYQDDVIVSARRDRLDGGVLCVYTSRAHRYRDLARTLLELWRVGIQRATQLECWQTAQLKVTAPAREYQVALDGEVIPLRLPLELRSRAGALRVAVPPAAG